MGLTFLTPLGALAVLAAVVPAAALLASAASGRRAASALRLGAAPWRTAAGPLALATLVCALLGLAAAQPALTSSEERSARTESELFFVVDVSRSMRASAGPGEPTRLERARAAVARLRAAVPDVPAGIAGLTDRALPYVFPTLEPATFAETLRVSVAPESPPPQRVAPVATSFGALAALAQSGFFTQRARHRTCVLVSDGESAPFVSGDVARALRGPSGCRLLAVHVGAGDERIWRPDGTPEPQYRPDPAASATVERLASVTGGKAFPESALGEAAAAVRAAAAAGPTSARGTGEDTRALAPFLAGAALLVVLFVVARRLATATLRQATRVSYRALAHR
jgi:hypothetical protein